MSGHLWTRWIPRLTLAAMAASVPLAPTLARPASDSAEHTLEIEMSASMPGRLQVFYDRGQGLSEAESASTSITATAEVETYRFPLPLGHYRLLRIDPNDRPGRYTIRALRIVSAQGEAPIVLPVDHLSPGWQVALEAHGRDGTTIVTTDAANDPQVLFDTGNALVLAPATPHWNQAGVVALLVLGLTAVLDRSRRARAAVSAIGRAVERRPSRAVVVAATLGTLLATYPLLLGRSLVSPANGSTYILYDQPPYTYGATDVRTEDTRGADVGAMMWAILPYTAVQREALAAGEFPLWNRYNTIGEPLWGQGQTFILDPTHLLSLAIPDPAIAMDVRFVVARAIFAIGAGLTVAMITGSGAAAVAVALTAPFVGHFIARFNHPAYFSLIWAPWILLAYAYLARQTTLGTRLGAGAWLAVATWLQLVGSTPKEGMVALGAAHLAGVIGLMAGPEPLSHKLGRLDAAVLGVVAALLAGAPHWLIFLDTLRQSWTIYDQPAVQLADRRLLLGYLLSDVYSTPPPTGAHSLAAVAAVAACLHPRRLWRSGIGFGAAGGVVLTGGLAFGLVPAEVLVKLPLVRNIHHLGDACLGATVPLLLVLAGVGVAQAIAEPAEGRAALRVAVAAVLTLLLIVWLMPADNLVGQLTTLLVTVAAGMAVLALAVSRRPLTAGTLLAMVVAAWAAVGFGGLHIETGVGLFDRVLMQPQTRVDLDQASPAISAIRGDAGTEPFRVAPVDAVLFPGTQAYWQLEGIGGPDALRLPAIEELSDVAGVERTSWTWWTILRADRLAVVGPYLDMLGVGYLVSRPDLQVAGGQRLATTGADRVEAVKRGSAWPRAFATDRVVSHRGVNEFSRILTHSRGPFASVDERDLSAIAGLEGLLGSGRWWPAHDYHLTPNTTSFRVETTGPAVAVLGEAYVEGDFVARVNGQDTPYFRVDHLFKGVTLPSAGSWLVEFRYRPARWQLSWVIAAFGAALWITLAVARRLLNHR